MAESVIQVEAIDEMTIAMFAKQHDLVIRVVERKKPIGDPSRFYARFDDCEETNGYVLIGTFGNGSTPEEAIREYAQAISLKRIAFRAFSPDRREIEVPRLYHPHARPTQENR